MTDSLFAFLARDLRSDLQTGAARTLAVSPAGRIWLLRWLAVCVIVGTTLYLFCGYHAGFERFNASAAGHPEWLWASLTVLGDERVPFALALLFCRRYPRVFWSLVVAGFVAVLFARGGKALFDALRPPGVLDADAFNLIGPEHRRGSFPSGHSVTAGVFFAVCVYHARTWELRSLLVTLGVLAGLSRIAVGVHWPVDVAAGLACGVLSALIGTKLASVWHAGLDRVAVHLAFVAVASGMAVSLLYWNGGYTGAILFLIVVGFAALASLTLQYLILPLSRWRSIARG